MSTMTVRGALLGLGLLTAYCALSVAVCSAVGRWLRERREVLEAAEANRVAARRRRLIHLAAEDYRHGDAA